MAFAVLAEVAKEKGVQFVDLFTPTLESFGKGQPHTINGVHLNAEGYRIWDQAVLQAAALACG